MVMAGSALTEDSAPGVVQTMEGKVDTTIGLVLSSEMLLVFSENNWPEAAIGNHKRAASNFFILTDCKLKSLSVLGTRGTGRTFQHGRAWPGQERIDDAAQCHYRQDLKDCLRFALDRE